MDLLKAKLRDGRPYEGNQQFAGRGVMRSCDKCGSHKPVGDLKKWRGSFLICPKCRGES